MVNGEWGIGVGVNRVYNGIQAGDAGDTEWLETTLDMEETAMDDQTPERLRAAPADRFAGPQHVFDLEEQARALGAERGAGEAGRRQETLYKRGPLTVSLFLFGRGTGLASHKAKGTVTIQVLQGHLQVTAEGQVHSLRGGSLLVLAPGVVHDVAAVEDSRMLLTVCLEGGGG